MCNEMQYLLCNNKAVPHAVDLESHQQQSLYHGILSL